MRTLLLAAVAALFVSQAQAAPPTVESVETLLTVTRSEAMLDSMYPAMEQLMRRSMQQATAGQTLTPEQAQIIETVPAKYMAVVRTEMTWDKLKPQYIQLYRDTFDQSEIDGLVAFYQSPAGRAFIDKMPIVLKKSLDISQNLMQGLYPKMKEAIDQAMADAKLAK